MIGLPPPEQMVVQFDVTLREAMVAIDRNAQGLCFVVQDGRAVGVVSDGDIRRTILRGVSIETPVSSAMRRDFVWLPVNTPIDQIQARLSEKITHIPILDSHGTLVDYACARRYHQVPLTQPVLDGNELEYVTDCIRTGWISSQGKYVRQFAASFGEYVNNPLAMAVSNGTAALHLALATLGVGPGDEVIVPDFTFAAAVNAVLYVGATPVLVDVDAQTMTLDVRATERALTSRTRAMIPVHLYGHPARMDQLMEIARRHNLIVVEDCAEALGSFFAGRHVGSLGDAAAFSFFGNKTITTGEGGMLLFKEKAMFERATMLRDHGMSPQRRYWHTEVGFNYRMTNIQAAIGLAQVERVADFVARKRWNAQQYHDRLSDVDGLGLPGDFGPVVNSYWLYTVSLPIEGQRQRDEVLHLLGDNGVEARPVFYPIHRMPPYQQFVPSQTSYPVSDSLADRGISLPSAVTMTEADLDKVCLVLKHALAPLAANV